MKLRFALTNLTLFTALISQPVLPGALAATDSGQSIPSTQAAASVTPDALYHQAWQLVRDNYYDSTYGGQESIGMPWSRWEHRYDNRLKNLDDAYKAIETMLGSLNDRYTRFLNPQAWSGETNAIQSKLFGIGIQMGADKTQNIVVIAPLEGTPAAKAGLLPLDGILEVDGKSTKGMSVEAVSQLIRGPIDTPVTLKILRNGEFKLFKITRAEIHVKSVQTARMLNSEIGYVRLSTFMSQTAGDEVRDALSQLSPARGIILDLRENPGGLVPNAIEICNIFLSSGIIVSTIDRHNNIQSIGCAGKPFYLKPLVILIDPGSASASEITSGALRDNDRAQLVGQTSFGKGLVQSVNKLNGGCGINITIARYVTPSGTDIHKKGIVPDYKVDLTIQDFKDAKGPWWVDPGGLTVKRNPEDLKDIQLKKAVEVLQNKLDNTTPTNQIQLQSPLMNF